MNNKSEAGFSYIDVMIAIIILLIGALGLLSAITGSVILSNSQTETLDARQISTSTMEAIISTKETNPDRLGWSSLGNVGSNPDPISGVNQGIFLTGVQPIRASAGLDQIVGTADDTGAALPNFTRQIVITDICDPDRPSPAPLCSPVGTYRVRMRSVQVTIFYNFGRLQKQEVLTTVLTDYALEN